MAAPLEAIALLTPFIQFFIIYIFAYRHEPLRLFHPKTERTGLKTWVAVFSELRFAEMKELLSMSEGNKRVRFVITLLVPTGAISVLLSLFEPLVVVGSVIAIFQPQLLFLLQFFPALLALVVLKRHIGPRPLSPYSTIIPDSHGSSLVRHLGEKGEGKR